MFKPIGASDSGMSQQLERECPKCEEEQTFTLTARTELHLGQKRKWRCSECYWGFVRIDGDVDTSAAA